MTTTAQFQKPEAVAFDRLHALVGRGYQPMFEGGQTGGTLSSIELRHPKSKGNGGPPPITLWSNGIISTTAILWPSQYVPSREGVPVWQKFIASDDNPCFTHFLTEVPKPGLYDRHLATTKQKVNAVITATFFAAALGGFVPLIVKILSAATAGAV